MFTSGRSRASVVLAPCAGSGYNRSGSGPATALT